MRRRLVETLVLLGLVAVLIPVMAQPEGETMPSLRDLTIDGLYPGMALSEVERQRLSPSTVFGTAGVYDNQRSINFVYGELVLRDGTPHVQKGDTEKRVYQKLGRPDRVREQVWTYEGAFAVSFRDGRLSGIFSDETYLTPMRDYYIACNGSSHYVPQSFFSGLVGESRDGRSVLLLDPWLTLGAVDRRFNSAFSTNQVILESGRVSVGQSPDSVSNALSENEVEVVEDRHTYTFTDFTLALEVERSLVVNIVVEPRPLNPEPNYEGILDLIERHP